MVRRRDWLTAMPMEMLKVKQKRTGSDLAKPKVMRLEKQKPMVIGLAKRKAKRLVKPKPRVIGWDWRLEILMG